MNVTFTVRKKFNYNGKDYKQGDVWEPGGFRNDDAIIDGGFVTESRNESPAPKQRRKRGTKSG